jgi:hypothetical protein
MCKLGKALKTGKYPGILYADQTQASQEMQRILDEAGAKYELADAGKEALPGPVLVVNGSFLGISALKAILAKS